MSEGPSSPPTCLLGNKLRSKIKGYEKPELTEAMRYKDSDQARTEVRSGEVRAGDLIFGPALRKDGGGGERERRAMKNYGKK